MKEVKYEEFDQFLPSKDSDNRSTYDEEKAKIRLFFKPILRTWGTSRRRSYLVGEGRWKLERIENGVKYSRRWKRNSDKINSEIFVRMVPERAEIFVEAVFTNQGRGACQVEFSPKTVFLRDRSLFLMIPRQYSSFANGKQENFFYGEKGSYYKLEGYLIDKECEYIHKVDMMDCSPSCNICKNACKTSALIDDYTMNPLLCTSFLTTFGEGKLTDDLSEDMLEEWICGCDACQDACPYNRHDWSKGKEFYGLEELVPLLEPENLVKASDEELIEKVIPKTDFHIPPEKIEILRRNARRAINYRKNKEM